MSLPTVRVLALLELLQSRRRATGPELAADLGIDARTLRRYIAKLEDLGVPITAERGRAGGYRVVAGFKLPPMMFTDDEAFAVALGLLVAECVTIHKHTAAVASARGKLERVMPERLRRRVRALSETIRLDPTLLTRRPFVGVNTEYLNSLTLAAQQQTRVRIRYGAPSGVETTRDIEAYGLALRQGAWYTVAYCHLRKDVRSFRLDRIRGIVPSEVPFEKPVDFDIWQHLEQGIATLPRAIGVQVLLRTDLETAQADFTPAIGIFESTAEGTLLRTRTDDLAWFARQLARVPYGFLIHFPEQLRQELNGIGTRLCAI